MQSDTDIRELDGMNNLIKVWQASSAHCTKTFHSVDGRIA